MLWWMIPLLWRKSTYSVPDGTTPTPKGLTIHPSNVADEDQLQETSCSGKGASVFAPAVTC